MENSEVSRVTDPNELEIAAHKMMSVRFDCLVKMYDFAKVKSENPMPYIKYPPQWFKSEIRFTMEFIESTDPKIIGMAVKAAYYELKKTIEKYENNL